MKPSILNISMYLIGFSWSNFLWGAKVKLQSYVLDIIENLV